MPFGVEKVHSTFVHSLRVGYLWKKNKKAGLSWTESLMGLSDLCRGYVLSRDGADLGFEKKKKSLKSSLAILLMLALSEGMWVTCRWLNLSCALNE